MIPEPLFCDGVDGSTGLYLTAPSSIQEVARIARGEKWDAAYVQKLKERDWREAQASFRLEDDTNANDLAEAGWGVIFAQDIKPDVREALKPLLDHRRAAASRKQAHYYREFVGPTAYHPGESLNQFLTSRGAELTGPVDPETMPYYLLLVGDPQQIPFRFQYELDIEYAVGRIAFPHAEDYARYAQAVVAGETAQPSSTRRMTFFGVRTPGDRATELSADHLIAPLASHITSKFPDWSVDVILGAEATKRRLDQVIHGPDAPALLFTASHGVAFPDGDPHKEAHQGALLCQDWPGPEGWNGRFSPEFYFSRDDLGSVAPLPGAISFHFACYSAATPDTNDFGDLSRRKPAARAFLAGLPMQMLSHPNGGPLAIVGHVERSWVCSFLDPQLRHGQLKVFRQMMQRLFKGLPIGHALEDFNLRHANLAARLTNELDQVRQNRASDPQMSAYLWMANHDARNYLLLGDPAVRLRPNTAATASKEGSGKD